MPVSLIVVIVEDGKPVTYTFRCVSPESAFDLMEKIGDVDEFEVHVDGEVQNAS